MQDTGKDGVLDDIKYKMLAEYMKNNSRKATKAELLLISFLVKKANLILNDNWHEDLTVSPMDDGGMGSLILDLDSDTDAKRTMGSQASECSFLDEDGMVVLAALNLDKNGKLFELDLWRVDFNPLKTLPLDESAYY